MKNIVIDTDGNITSPTDYSKKLEEVKSMLLNSILSSSSVTGSLQTEDEELDQKKKKKGKVEEISRPISPMLVSCKLNEILRIYRPLTIQEAQALDEKDLLDAFECYMQLITFLNAYTIFVPSKQSFCAFSNITTSIYNELLKNGNFASIFEGIEDYLIDQNFMASQSGLAKERTVITRLQTREAGHSLIKNPDTVSLTQNNYQLDPAAIDADLRRISSNFGFAKRLEKK